KAVRNEVRLVAFLVIPRRGGRLGSTHILEGLSQAVSRDLPRRDDACNEREAKGPLPHVKREDRQPGRHPVCRRGHWQTRRRGRRSNGVSSRRGRLCAARG